MRPRFERLARFGLCFCLALVALLSVQPDHASARAPDTFEELHAKPTVIDSPYWYAFELRVGPYVPASENDAFKETFGSDRGWMLGLEVDFTLWHIPYVGTINLGAGWGRAKYDANAFDAAGGRAGEKTEFILYPMSALGVLRVDALARYAGIPVLFAGKLGYDFVRWKADTGGSTDGSGLNMGLRWGAQAALELDFFEEDSARSLDQEFGINHTFLFGEFYESRTRGTGDRTFAIGFGTIF